MVTQVEHRRLVGCSLVAYVECIIVGHRVSQFDTQVAGETVFAVGRKIGQGNGGRRSLLCFPHTCSEIWVTSVCRMSVDVIGLQAIFLSVECISCLQDASDISSYGSSIILWLTEVTVYIRESADDVLQLTVAVGYMSDTTRAP